MIRFLVTLKNKRSFYNQLVKVEQKGETDSEGLWPWLVTEVFSRRENHNYTGVFFIDKHKKIYS